MSRTDRMQEQALELGQRNLEAIELVRKHCANARVEHHPMGGIGMLEEMTGLPIGMKTVRCEHAPKPPNFAAHEFLRVALSFYKNNCVGCAHRIIVGIPNLATVASDVDQQEQAEAERRAREEAREQEERQERHREREQRVMNEPRTTRDLVKLINQLDTREHLSEPGERLVATVKGAPTFVTSPIGDVLLEAAAVGLNEYVLEAVRVAAEAGQIAPNEAVRAAARCLERASLLEAGRTLLRFRSGVTPELLAPVRRRLIVMVGRTFGPSFLVSSGEEAESRRSTWHAAFDMLVDLDLAGVLATIESMLESDAEYERERAAAAVEVLVDRQPEIAPVVARQLVAALGKADDADAYDFDHRASRVIGTTLSRCLWHRPRETSQAMEAGAKSLSDDQRSNLFYAYDSVIRTDRSDSVPQVAGAIVIDACLKHTQGDWGPETQRAAHDTLELISKWHGSLLDDHAGALFSLLLNAISVKPPDTPPPERASDPMWFLERMSNSSTRNARIRDMRETIGGVAARRPREVLDLIKTFLGEEVLQVPETVEMRAECTWLLGFVGRHSDLLGEVMPLLYSGLVHSEQIVRASAIDGLIELVEVHAGDAIPVEFSATIPALLTDTFVIVHKAMLRALTRGVPVRDEHRPTVIACLVQLADHYAKTGNDSDALDNALRGLQITGRYESDPDIALAVNRFVSRLAAKLDSYDLQHFLERGSRSLLDFPEYAASLVDALQRLEIAHEPNRGDSRLRAILFRMPPAILIPHAPGLHAAALAHLPDNPWSALEYVEVLQRLGLWDEAVELADAVVAAVPVTVDHAPARTRAERVRAWARVEADIATGAGGVTELLDEAVRATKEHAEAKAKAKTELPWEV